MYVIKIEFVASSKDYNNLLQKNIYLKRRILNWD